VRMSTRFMNGKARKEWASSAIILDPSNVYCGRTGVDLDAHNRAWSSMQRDPFAEVPWEFPVDKFMARLAQLVSVRGMTQQQMDWWKDFLHKRCTVLTDELCVQCRALRVSVEEATRKVPRRVKKGQVEDAAAKTYRCEMEKIKRQAVKVLKEHLEDIVLHASQLQVGWWTTPLPNHEHRPAGPVFAPQQLLTISRTITLQPDGTMAPPDVTYGMLRQKHGKEPGQDATAPVEPGMLVAIRPPMETENWWPDRDKESPFFYLGMVKKVRVDPHTRAFIGVTVRWYARLGKPRQWWKTRDAMDDCVSWPASSSSATKPASAPSRPKPAATSSVPLRSQRAAAKRATAALESASESESEDEDAPLGQAPSKKKQKVTRASESEDEDAPLVPLKPKPVACSRKRRGDQSDEEYKDDHMPENSSSSSSSEEEEAEEEPISESEFRPAPSTSRPASSAAPSVPAPKRSAAADGKLDEDLMKHARFTPKMLAMLRECCSWPFVPRPSAPRPAKKSKARSIMESSLAEEEKKESVSAGMLIDEDGDEVQWKEALLAWDMPGEVFTTTSKKLKLPFVRKIKRALVNYWEEVKNKQALSHRI
jgi:hypothetical protein